MNPQLYTAVSNEAGERYLVVLAAFRSLLFTSLSQPFSERGMRALRDEANRIVDSYARTERVLIEDHLRDTAQNAQRSAWSDLNGSGEVSIPPHLEPFLTQSVEHLFLEVGAQLARDVETLVRRYREFGFEAQLKATASGFAPGAAIAGLHQDDKIKFYFRDRAGRITPSQRFVRVAWRQSLVSLGAEFYLLEAVARGAKSVAVEHPDPKHRFYGTQVDVGNGGEGFHEIRDEIFHPMTEAVLKASS